MYVHSLAALTSRWDKTTLLCCSASTPILQKLPKCLQGFALSATQHSSILLITWLLRSKGPQSAYFLSFNWLTLITVPAVQVLKLKKGLLLLLLLPLESHLQSQKPLLHLFLGSFQFPPKWLRPILKTSLIAWISLALHTNILPTPHQDRLMPPVKTENYITPRPTWSLCDGLQSLKSSQMPLAALMPLMDHLPTLLPISVTPLLSNDNSSITVRMIQSSSLCLPDPHPLMAVDLLPHLNLPEITSQRPLPCHMHIQSPCPASLCHHFGVECVRGVSTIVWWHFGFGRVTALPQRLVHL